MKEKTNDKMRFSRIRLQENVCKNCKSFMQANIRPFGIKWECKCGNSLFEKHDK